MSAEKGNTLTLLTAEDIERIVGRVVESALAKAHDREVFNSEEAGKFLDLHPSVVTRYARTEGLPGVQLPGGEWRFLRADLLTWLASRKTKRSA